MRPPALVDLGIFSVELGERPSAPRAEARTLPQAAALFFRFRSPKLLALAVLLPLAVRVIAGGFTIWDPILALAIVPLWSIQEWWMHKHLLHAKPRKVFGRLVDPTFAKRHRAHHRRPWSLSEVFLPSSVVLLAFPVSVALWMAALPTVPLALTAITAYSMMALAYEWTHFLTHTPYKPKSRYYAKICRGHRLHHFKNEQYWYGFTIPYVDDVLRTSPDQSAIEVSPTVRTLGVTSDDLEV
jgi:hypothetical protein